MKFMTLEEAWKLILQNEKLEYYRRDLSFMDKGTEEVAEYYKDKSGFHFYGEPNKYVLAFRELDAHTCLVTELYVVPEERMKGRSFELFDKIFKMFDDHDFIVNVNSRNNIGAIAYYKNGFRYVKDVDIRNGFVIRQYKKERGRT